MGACLNNFVLVEDAPVRVGAQGQQRGKGASGQPQARLAESLTGDRNSHGLEEFQNSRILAKSGWGPWLLGWVAWADGILPASGAEEKRHILSL